MKQILLFTLILFIPFACKTKSEEVLPLDQQILGEWKVTDFNNNGLSAKEFESYLQDVKKFTLVTFQFNKGGVMQIYNSTFSNTDTYELIGSNLAIGDIAGPITISGNKMILMEQSDKVNWVFTKNK